jgi:hypothetical protein
MAFAFPISVPTVGTIVNITHFRSTGSRDRKLIAAAVLLLTTF